MTVRLAQGTQLPVLTDAQRTYDSYEHEPMSAAPARGPEGIGE